LAFVDVTREYTIETRCVVQSAIDVRPRLLPGNAVNRIDAEFIEEFGIEISAVELVLRKCDLNGIKPLYVQKPSCDSREVLGSSPMLTEKHRTKDD